MKLSQYLDEIKLQLTGGVLELEIDDATLIKVVEKSFREIQRYIDCIAIKTIPFSNCMDTSQLNISYVHKVLRAQRYVGANDFTSGVSMNDPMYAASWQLYSGGNLYNFPDYVYNYTAYNQMQQIQNTVNGADMSFMFDRAQQKLYVNCVDKPTNVTLLYTPIYSNVEDIDNDFWCDIISKLAIATTKIILGRIRTRYTQSNALWQQDGQQLLSEGTQEVQDIREKLKAETNLLIPID